jgi:hypothetical protein
LGPTGSTRDIRDLKSMIDMFALWFAWNHKKWTLSSNLKLKGKTQTTKTCEFCLNLSPHNNWVQPYTMPPTTCLIKHMCHGQIICAFSHERDWSSIHQWDL